MRLAVISDIHGECFTLDQVLQDIRRQGIEQIVCLGDAIQGVHSLPRLWYGGAN